MATLMFVRFVFWTILELFLVSLGAIALVEDVREKGFHWFKTPFSAAWLMIGYLCIFYKVLDAMVKDSDAKEQR